MAGFAHECGSGVDVFVDAVAESHEARLVGGVFDVFDKFADFADRSDLTDHGEGGFVGAAVCGPPEAGDAG